MARAGITRARLAAVGAELADELGFERVTLAEVARRCGVQTPSLYSHVSGTGELREQVTLLALEEMADRAAEAVAGLAGKAALTGLANSYRDYAWQHPGRFTASAAAAGLDAETAAGSAGPRHARFTEAVLRGYTVDPESHVHAVRMLGSTVRGFITLEMSGSFDHSSPPAAESWAQIIHGLDTLFRSWSTAPDEEPPPPRAEDPR
ncbi:TetR/AcrR family transcriptional regulator [Nesterenkonia halotolerans]|uniref:AcrR family transcriptional regulator n=1 Tax=Nesterenkonia halotolerans TaxID=225325 RepID=A0ABR9J8I5_9MICC|nr:TetR/AcrR family transcriptional regulator [Nesterenkonia halotolerans]MBE1515319.1 AcrR family transcriptional regulator [Nesterenkonia halotolerans]